MPQVVATGATLAVYRVDPGLELRARAMGQGLRICGSEVSMLNVQTFANGILILFLIIIITITDHHHHHHHQIIIFISSSSSSSSKSPPLNALTLTSSFTTPRWTHLNSQLCSICLQRNVLALLALLALLLLHCLKTALLYIERKRLDPA